MTAHRRDAPGVCDRGSATVWAVAVVAVLLAATATGLAVGSAALLRLRAAAAADVAALAAAGDVVAGPTLACARAGRWAGVDGARLVRCLPTGAVVTVGVKVDPPPWLGWLGGVTQTARAGPRGINR